MFDDVSSREVSSGLRLILSRLLLMIDLSPANPISSPRLDGLFEF